MDDINSDEFFTVPEVAKKLKMHRQTVLAKIASGDLVACRFGPTTIRIKKEDFKAYVQRASEKRGA